MNTIRNRILAALTATAMIPLVVLYFTTDSMIRSSVLKTESEKLEKINGQLATHVKTLMQSYEHDLKALQTDPVLTDCAASAEMRLLQMNRLVDIYEFFSDISLYDSEGYLIESTVEDHPAYRESSIWFTEAIEKNQTTISRPQLVIGSNELNLSVYLPVTECDGESISVLRARLTFDRISRLIQSLVPGESGEFILIDQWGGVLSANSKDELLEPLDPSRNLEQWTSNSLEEYVAAGGEKYMVSVKMIEAHETRINQPWGLVALQPMEEIDALIGQAHHILRITTLITLIGAALIGIVLSNRFSRPLVNLSNTAKNVAKGALDMRAEAAGSVEMIELSNSFNQMVTDLREYQQGLENLVETRTHSLHQSQKEHEKTSAHLQAALEGSNNGFLVEDFGGQIVAVNQRFLDIFGFDREQIAGRGIDEVIDEMLKRAQSQDDTEEVRKAIKNPEGMVHKEIIFETHERCYLDIHSAPIRNKSEEIIGRVWTLRDNTENRQLEESLRQSQKMEAIGQLAGGVAHDFNNLLTGILGNLSLIEVEGGPDQVERNQKLLRRAIGAGDRAVELVKSLLGFSRRSHMDLRPCDSNDVLSEVQGLLVATIDPSIRVEVELEEAPWGLMADSNRLSQVIMNMAVNAKDAINKKRDGIITLQSKNRTLTENEARQITGLSAGDYICLSVADNGSGIPEHLKDRIFEPFFTTKEQGRGTGLGLATSFGIVKQLGGSIHVESVPGEGTRFDVFLPRSIHAESQPTARESVVEAPESKTREYTVLVVDDEDLVRRVGVSLLKKQGFRTLTASSGEKALEVIEKHEKEIDLIILDLTMPGLSGAETFWEIRARFDYLPVVICSGYLVDIKELETESGSCPDAFVQKPYQIETMSKTIDKIVKNRDSEAA